MHAPDFQVDQKRIKISKIQKIKRILYASTTHQYQRINKHYNQKRMRERGREYQRIKTFHSVKNKQKSQKRSFHFQNHNQNRKLTNYVIVDLENNLSF